MEIKLRFQIPPVPIAFSKNSVFHDGLEWTVGQTVEIKLCFQISPVSIAFSKSSRFFFTTD